MRRFVLFFLFTGSAPLGCQPPPPAMPETAAPTAAAEGSEAATEEESEAANAEASKDPEVSQENLPAAEDLIEGAVEALGGRDKIDSIKSYYAETEMAVPAQNMTMLAKTWWKNGRFYSESTIPSVGLFKVWATPDGVWSEDPINGLREVEGDEAEQARRGNSIALVADWEEHFESAETTGRRKTEDATVVDVVFKAKNDDNVTLSFDEKTGLPIEYAFVQHSPQGEMPVKVYVEEFEDYDGLKREKKTLTDMTLVKATTTTTKFEPNAKVPDAKLKPPKTAKAKADKAKADKAKAKK